MKLNKSYAILTLLLFIIEVFIGMYMHDDLIRPFGGDLLVVILIYCFVKCLIDIPWPVAAIGTLIFSYIVEISQHFTLLKHLGLQNSKLAAILLGQSFSWGDMLCYTAGIFIVIIAELFYNKAKNNLSKANII
ncbi:Protein of unknown function [Mucilaginibacter gossypiicola]|uniref:DUF2809 domain-containing protein n=1 Tax=Mucilaginibacter gossypiicola TaxID=551995 RepID=A0A1H8JP72_9SPHI|nr:DUF2809 domain-containing protein [Mucilaginibacter gossypiicola]SEN81988.1 Protein of unknown function [Mucilaginibacter gossypiicola]